MANIKSKDKSWWAKGLLFENCTCQLLCPAHVSFKQKCEGEQCFGYWGISFEQGMFAGSELQPQCAAVLYRSPPSMFEGNWTFQLYLDDGVSPEQQSLVEYILTGDSGGPWEIINQFVSNRLETHPATIDFSDDGRTKTFTVKDTLVSTLKAVANDDSGEVVTLNHLHNVVHSSVQYLAKGSSEVTGQILNWSSDQKHSLYSKFSWKGS
ncbi:DUF1326 domain-containing protein [Pseudomonadota bacterium]